MREPVDEISAGQPDARPPRAAALVRRALFAVAVVVAGVVAVTTGTTPSLQADRPAPAAPSTSAQPPEARGDQRGSSETGAGQPATLVPLLSRLPADSPPTIDFAVGSVIHTGRRKVQLPPAWRVRSLWTVPGGWVVSAEPLTDPPILALVDRVGKVRRLTGKLDPGLTSSVVVDPSGRRAAWVRQRGAGRFDLQVTNLRTGATRRAMDLRYPSLLHTWVAGDGPLLSAAVGPATPPQVADLRTRTLRRVVAGSAGEAPRYLAYSSASDHLLLALPEGKDKSDACRLLPEPDRPIRDVTCLSHWGRASLSPGPVRHQRLALIGDSRVEVFSADGYRERLFRGPDFSYVSEIGWEGPDTGLAVAVVTNTGTTHVVRCSADGGCTRAYDGKEGESVTLARLP